MSGDESVLESGFTMTIPSFNCRKKQLVNPIKVSVPTMNIPSINNFLDEDLPINENEKILIIDDENNSLENQMRQSMFNDLNEVSRFTQSIDQAKALIE